MEGKYYEASTGPTRRNVVNEMGRVRTLLPALRKRNFALAELAVMALTKAEHSIKNNIKNNMDTALAELRKVQ